MYSYVDTVCETTTTKMANSDNIRSIFEAAIDYVRENTRSFDSDTLLQLYARYKQVCQTFSCQCK